MEHVRPEDELHLTQLGETLPADASPLPAMRAEHDQSDEERARLAGLAGAEPDWRPLLNQTPDRASVRFEKEERVLSPQASRQVAARRPAELGEWRVEGRQPSIRGRSRGCGCGPRAPTRR